MFYLLSNQFICSNNIPGKINNGATETFVPHKGHVTNGGGFWFSPNVCFHFSAGDLLLCNQHSPQSGGKAVFMLITPISAHKLINSKVNFINTK